MQKKHIFTQFRINNIPSYIDSSDWIQIRSRPSPRKITGTLLLEFIRLYVAYKLAFIRIILKIREFDDWSSLLSHQFLVVIYYSKLLLSNYNKLLKPVFGFKNLLWMILNSSNLLFYSLFLSTVFRNKFITCANSFVSIRWALIAFL